jgi:hypothetical protein
MLKSLAQGFLKSNENTIDEQFRAERLVHQNFIFLQPRTKWG